MRIEAVQGDITEQDLDVVVNAANAGLLGGGGVDGAIHRAAGPQLLEACREIRRTSHPEGLPVGDAVLTPGFDLPARWVVHTVGPNWHAGERSSTMLASCFLRSLELAVEAGATSIAFPAVSGGAYGWDLDEVAGVAVRSVRAWAYGARGGEVIRDDVPDDVGDGARGDDPSDARSGDDPNDVRSDDPNDVRSDDPNDVRSGDEPGDARATPQSADGIELVRFVLFSSEALSAFERALAD